MLIAQKANHSGPFFPRFSGTQRAQTEQHQAKAKHAVYAEKRSVSVNGGRVQPLHVVERDGRIDQKPNNPAPTKFQNATATKK